MKKLPFIIIPLILLINLLTNTLAYYTRVLIKWNIYLNEMFVIGILVLIFLTLFRSSRFDEIGITQRLRLALLIVMGFFISGMVVIALTEPEFVVPRMSTGYVFRPNSWTAVIVATVIGAAALIGMALCFRVLKTLIYYRQKKNTRFYFIMLVISGALTILSAAASEKPLKYDFGYNFIITSALLTVTTVFMIPNLFRVGWVTVLNRRQKFLTFLGGIAFVFVASSLFGAEIAAGVTFADMVNTYSIMAGSFLFLTTIFMLIYSVIVTLNALFHLPTAAIYDKKVREINSIYNMSRAINTVFDFDRIVQSATELVCDATGANACWLDIAHTKNPSSHDRLYLAAIRQKEPFRIAYLDKKNKRGEKNYGSINATDRDIVEVGLSLVADEVLRTRKPLLINQVKKDKLTKNLKKTPAESLLAVPLISFDDTIGIMYAVKSMPFGFDQDDIAIVSAFSNQTTVSIENARLVQASIEKERLAEELRIAHEVQMRLIPQDIPDIRHEAAGLLVDVGAATLPAKEVGGDYYDFLELPDNRTGIVVADVSGKGTSAAFYMAEIKGIIQALAKIHRSPSELLVAVNQVLYGSVDRKTFITLIYADIDVAHERVSFARAGHCPILHISGTGLQFIRPNGIGLGLDPGAIFNDTIESVTFSLAPGDLFLLYSDGLVEARNMQGQEYGEELLCRITGNSNHLSASGIKDAILADVQAFVGQAKNHDDLTCVVLKVMSIPAVKKMPAMEAQERVLGELRTVENLYTAG